MFQYVLVLLYIGNGEPPEAIATFKRESDCQVISKMLNKGFEQKDIDIKARCIEAVPQGSI